MAIKYCIPSSSPIKNWVKLYNRSYRTKRLYSWRRRYLYGEKQKVNKEERIEIIKYCLEHDMDYKITAKLFETTYANVFNWVKKYKEKGEDGLGDKRGCRKDDEKVDEVTLLKRQLKQKEYELEMVQLELKLS